jgi:aminopeptidase N
MQVRREPGQAADTPLVLDGRDLELLFVRLDGHELDASRYQRDERALIIHGLPDTASLEISTRIHPAANTALEGLYPSGAMLCTQCEPHGFSRITYFLDRPDVMTRYRVRLSADKALYPVLLANGNPVDSGTGENGRHWVVWEDPFPKPCYLFALVAGDLALIEDQFVTATGRKIALRIYVEPENQDKCAHAMTSLKQAMRWDEEAYGREYDLDIFMIVAVGSFNMGAMENKGLNIFNAKYIIADPQTATDDDHEAVRDIIGHEYFHNWTGNRITCRDWFQLSVKESLTVFREQQFSAAMGSEAITRIRQARLIRTQQFPEDAGPTAHPVRPDSYMEVNNLYTLTVYEKGSEVIRMLHTLLGSTGFRRAMDRYFDQHDGQAVTVEDFLAVMETASERDLSQFRLWYSQAGTPVITAEWRHEPAKHRHVLTLKQSTPATPGQALKQPLHIPVRAALVNPDGGLQSERLLELRQAEESFEFADGTSDSTISLLRGFSAPVQLAVSHSDEELQRLVAALGDGYARWDAMQRLFLNSLLSRVASLQAQRTPPPTDALIQAVLRLLDEPDSDHALLAELLLMPGESVIADQLQEVNMQTVIRARADLRTELSMHLYPGLLRTYESCMPACAYQFEMQATARRRLGNTCLSWLTAQGGQEARTEALRHYQRADNMTDALGALHALNDIDCPERIEALAHFRDRWQKQALVLDKWYTLQATTRLPSAIETVRSLLQGASFDSRNPNRVRALLGAFAHANPTAFHRADGAGYALVADHILQLDALNPQVAARLAAAFTRWRRSAEPQRSLMRVQLERLRHAPGLSADVHEIVTKSLG